MSELRITEIFYSLQGETNTVGLPTVFVRLTGCPLRCVYCDTAYAFNGGEKQSIAAIIDQVCSYNTKFVTVTGGEPLAQTASLKLLTALADAGFTVSLETSGAMDIADVDERVVTVMDIKTPGSGEEHRNLYENITHLKPHDQVKFVITDIADYQWATALMDEHGLAKTCEVLFSPSKEQFDPTTLAELILQDQLAVRFQLQIHKFLWGDVPGK